MEISKYNTNRTLHTSKKSSVAGKIIKRANTNA